MILTHVEIIGTAINILVGEVMPTNFPSKEGYFGRNK